MYIKKECPQCHCSVDIDKETCPLCGYTFQPTMDDEEKTTGPANQSTPNFNFCPNCGKELIKPVNFCPRCGFKINDDNKYEGRNEANQNEIGPYSLSRTQDKYSGTIEEDDEFYGCGEIQKKPKNNESKTCLTSDTGRYKNNLIAGLLAFILGYYGIHNFYLRRFKSAVIQLLFGSSASIMFYLTQVEKIQYSIPSNFGLKLLLMFTYASFICGGINIIWWIIDFLSICLRSKSMKSPDRPMSYHSYDKVVFSILILLAICSGIFAGVYQGVIEKQNQEALAIVRDITLEQYPDIPLPTLTGSLISSSKWKQINSDTINVSGEISYWGRPATIEIGFIINDDNTANVYAIEINGTPQTYIQRQLLLERMYDLAKTNRIQLN